MRSARNEETRLAVERQELEERQKQRGVQKRPHYVFRQLPEPEQPRQQPARKWPIEDITKGKVPSLGSRSTLPYTALPASASPSAPLSAPSSVIHSQPPSLGTAAPQRRAPAMNLLGGVSSRLAAVAATQAQAQPAKPPFPDIPTDVESSPPSSPILPVPAAPVTHEPEPEASEMNIDKRQQAKFNGKLIAFDGSQPKQFP
jgi:hypothetical protein